MIATTLLCLVVGVADGDTLTARCGAPGSYEQVKVRIAGIDAPEKQQAFGNRSKQSLSDLCFKQQSQIKKLQVDRYGRIVGDVQCQGVDVGFHQVSQGMAWVYDRYAKDHKHLYPLQKSARAQKLGLWSDPLPTPPWNWRRQK